jgi:hypothetical protein
MKPTHIIPLVAGARVAHRIRKSRIPFIFVAAPVEARLGDKLDNRASWWWSFAKWDRRNAEKRT